MANKKTEAEKAATKAKAAAKRKARDAERRQGNSGLIPIQCPKGTGAVGVGREHGTKQYKPDDDGIIMAERRDVPTLLHSGMKRLDAKREDPALRRAPGVRDRSK